MRLRAATRRSRRQILVRPPDHRCKDLAKMQVFPSWTWYRLIVSGGQSNWKMPQWALQSQIFADARDEVNLSSSSRHQHASCHVHHQNSYPIETITYFHLTVLSATGGVKRISVNVYDEARSALKNYVSEIVKDATVYAGHCKSEDCPFFSAIFLVITLQRL